MRKEELNNALNHIDYDLVEEFVEEKEELNKSLAKRRTIMHLAPIAASFVLILCISAIIVPTIFGGADTNKPTLPEDSSPEIQKPGSFTTTVSPTTTVPPTTILPNETQPPQGEEKPPEDPIPPSDSSEDEGVIKPEGDWGFNEDTCPYAFTFTVMFEGEKYTCCFGAPNETDYYAALEKYRADTNLVGAYIGMVSGRDSSGFSRQFKVYELLGDTDRDIIIEIEDGYFFIATK